MRSTALLVTLLSISTVALTLVSRSAAPAQIPSDKAELARQAFAVLNESCIGCHGPDLASKGLRLDSYAAIMKGGESGQPVTSGKPDESLLIKMMLGEGVTLMPPGGPKLAQAKIDTVRAWIAAGAPDAVAVPEPKVSRPFVTEGQMLQLIRDDLNRAPERSRSYLRYFTLTNLANAGASDAEIREYRLGFSKLINSVSWQKDIAVPQPVDPAQTIFRIDIRKYAWTNTTWQKLLDLYPYGVQSNSSVAKEIYRITGCELPYVRADWFVANAALPPLYHDLLDLPTHVDALERKLGVDVTKNIQEETAVRAGLLQSGVSRNNRIIERHPSAYGAYWRSYDFATNTGKQNIFKNPLGFEAAGGEIIFNLPNGLQAYFLTDDKGNRIDTGPTNIVDNGKNPNRKPNDPIEVRNGLTCMSCHSEGMRSDFKDNLRAVLQATKPSDVDYDHAKALALYTNRETLDGFLEDDKRRFKNAVEATGATITGIEPIFALQGAYDSTVSVAQVASDLGLTEAQFVAKLNTSGKLAALLGTLKTPGGVIKRDAWEEYFGDSVGEFKLGKFIKPTKVAVVKNPVQPESPNTIPSAIAGGRFASAAAKVRGQFPALAKYLEEFCEVPAGPFTMGDDDSDDEKPKRQVNLSRFYMGRTEVTVALWQEYARAKLSGKMPTEPTYEEIHFNPNWSKDDHPIVNVSWNDIMGEDGKGGFCAWATEVSGVRITLPTEAQWEKAARGTDGREFPWQGTFDPDRLWSSRSKFGDAGGTQRVGRFPNGASPNGCLDMAGNVWEWCLDYYAVDFYGSRQAEEDDPVNLSYGAREAKVLRGGSWSHSLASVFRGADRYWVDPAIRNNDSGFRLSSPGPR